MNRATVLTLAVLLIAAALAQASDPVGIYAMIDKVVLEPSDGPAERVQVVGVFCLARNGGDEYAAPERGFLYYALVKDKEKECRNEWADFKKVAGTGQCIAFGSRYGKKGTVRKPGSDLKNADPYPLGFGVQKVGDDNPVITQRLRVAPNPVEPSEGDLVPTGSITLRIRNSAGSGSSAVKYLFSIEDEAGKQEASDQIAPGDKETSWTPKMQLKAGGKYTWRVWTRVDDKEDKSQVVTTHFIVKGKP
jgi:hypothetical protein